MGRKKIPLNIVRQEIRWYLDGLSMKEIADKVGISKTSVYNIIDLKNTLGFKLALFHEIAINLAKKRLNIDDFGEIIRAGKLLEKYGIDKGTAWQAIAAIPIACFQIDIEPRNLIAFLHRFEQFVAISKVKSLKEAFELAKTSVSTYFSFMHRKIKLKEEIAGLEATRQRKEQGRNAFGRDIAISNEYLRKALEDEQIKNNKLNEELEIRSITSPETMFTNKESLKRLNARFGLTLSLDEVFRMAMDLMKYPHKNPAFFMQPETERRVTRIRRRRRIRTGDRANNKYK
jgi:hypothetical protein